LASIPFLILPGFWREDFLSGKSPKTQSLPQPGSRRNRVGSVIVILGLAVLLILAILYLFGVFSEQDQIAESTPESVLPTQTISGPFIQITDPTAGAVLDISQPVILRGMAGMLFEGNLVVQALDADGKVLAVEPTIIQSPEAGVGGTGPWEVSLAIVTPPGTTGKIIAFAASPMDGSRVAEATIDVMFGQGELGDQGVLPEDHQWLLQDLRGQPASAEAQVTIEFINGRVTGNTGCNQYNAVYTLAGEELTIGTVATTRRRCDSLALTDQEAAFLEALASTDKLLIQDNQLQFLEKTNQTHMVFSAAITGLVVNQEEPLPPESLVIVRLMDAASLSESSSILAEQRLDNPSGFPVSFGLVYNPWEIKPGQTYTIQVRIEAPGGDLLFSSLQAIPVLTQGAPRYVEIVVGSVR
jgi:heat shock protein HslJ